MPQPWPGGGEGHRTSPSPSQACTSPTCGGPATPSATRCCWRTTRPTSPPWCPWRPRTGGVAVGPGPCGALLAQSPNPKNHNPMLSVHPGFSLTNLRKIQISSSERPKLCFRASRPFLECVFFYSDHLFRRCIEEGLVVFGLLHSVPWLGR